MSQRASGPSLRLESAGRGRTALLGRRVLLEKRQEKPVNFLQWRVPDRWATASLTPQGPHEAPIPKCGHASTRRSQAPFNCMFLQCNFVRHQRAHALPDPADRLPEVGLSVGPLFD